MLTALLTIIKQWKLSKNSLIIDWIGSEHCWAQSSRALRMPLGVPAHSWEPNKQKTFPVPGYFPTNYERFGNGAWASKLLMIPSQSDV